MKKFSIEERMELLLDCVKSSKLNHGEIDMIHGVLGLSKERNDFEKRYNSMINEILKKKEDE